MKNVDKIYCINLNKRKDRWIRSKKEFAKINILTQVERFPAIEHKYGIVGCTLSHLEIVKICKKKGYKSVIIFEDDVEFLHLDKFYKFLGSAYHQLKEEWDMFYLGGTLYGKKNEKIYPNVIKINHAKATHAYIISERIYDDIIDKLGSIDPNDKKNWDQTNPERYNIDEFYIREFQSKGNVYGVQPMLARQFPGYSDIWDKNRKEKDNGRNKTWKKVKRSVK